jgi:hypothetical protein
LLLPSALQLAHACLSELGPDPRTETVSATVRHSCGGLLLTTMHYDMQDVITRSFTETSSNTLLIRSAIRALFPVTVSVYKMRICSTSSSTMNQSRVSGSIPSRIHGHTPAAPCAATHRTSVPTFALASLEWSKLSFRFFL